jgi:hypothetical protein
LTGATLPGTVGLPFWQSWPVQALLVEVVVLRVVLVAPLSGAPPEEPPDPDPDPRPDPDPALVVLVVVLPDPGAVEEVTVVVGAVTVPVADEARWVWVWVVPIVVERALCDPPQALSPSVRTSEPSRAASIDRLRPRPMRERSGWLLQALARFAHERDRFGEDDRHHRAQLLGLLLRRALDVDAVDRRHGEIDREFDGVVRPREPLRTLHLLGELAEPALQIVGITEHTAEAASFHGSHGSSPELRLSMGS